MATYLNQDKNAILNEIGGGIEYYDTVIKTTFDILTYITQNFTRPITTDTPDGKSLIEQLNKAVKSLNIYLIIDDTIVLCIGRYGNILYFGYNMAGTSHDSATIYYFSRIDETSWNVQYEDY